MRSVAILASLGPSLALLTSATAAITLPSDLSRFCSAKSRAASSVELGL